MRGRRLSPWASGKTWLRLYIYIYIYIYLFIYLFTRLNTRADSFISVKQPKKNKNIVSNEFQSELGSMWEPSCSILILYQHVWRACVRPKKSLRVNITGFWNVTACGPTKVSVALGSSETSELTRRHIPEDFRYHTRHIVVPQMRREGTRFRDRMIKPAAVYPWSLNLAATSLQLCTSWYGATEAGRLGGVRNCLVWGHLEPTDTAVIQRIYRV